MGKSTGWMTLAMSKHVPKHMFEHVPKHMSKHAQALHVGESTGRMTLDLMHHHRLSEYGKSIEEAVEIRAK